MKIPEKYLPLMPYLILNNAAAFSDFAVTVFNAKVQLLVPGEHSKVMHGELRIGEAVVMFADATEKWKEKPSGMYLYVPDVDSTYNLALIAGAESLMPPGKHEYGYTAGFEDPFGNQWWIVEPEKD
ncbi:VOC family protein [Rubrolithibacter danxiaensis]|uniref:VOC family protein n=1 Tax=Rubrolithibacter danxiaensis TaxID=3390805 RepID=UPI003BF83587